MGRSLHLRLMPLEQLLATSPAGFERVLGVSMFGADAVPARLRARDVPTVRVQAPVAGAGVRAAGPQPDVLFVQADICRRELLVEIEAVAWPEPERPCVR
jgi:hypothetical protein